MEQPIEDTNKIIVEPDEIPLESRIIQLEKELETLKLTLPKQKNNLTHPNVIKACKKYYQKKKNDLDFRIRIREYNRKARERMKQKKLNINDDKKINILKKNENNEYIFNFFDNDDNLGF